MTQMVKIPGLASKTLQETCVYLTRLLTSMADIEKEEKRLLEIIRKNKKITDAIKNLQDAGHNPKTYIKRFGAPRSVKKEERLLQEVLNKKAALTKEIDIVKKAVQDLVKKPVEKGGDMTPIMSAPGGKGGDIVRKTVKKIEGNVQKIGENIARGKNAVVNWGGRVGSGIKALVTSPAGAFIAKVGLCVGLAYNMYLGAQLGLEINRYIKAKDQEKFAEMWQIVNHWKKTASPDAKKEFEKVMKTGDGNKIEKFLKERMTKEQYAKLVRAAEVARTALKNRVISARATAQLKREEEEGKKTIQPQIVPKPTKEKTATKQEDAKTTDGKKQEEKKKIDEEKKVVPEKKEETTTKLTEDEVRNIVAMFIQNNKKWLKDGITVEKSIENIINDIKNGNVIAETKEQIEKFCESYLEKEKEISSKNIMIKTLEGKEISLNALLEEITRIKDELEADRNAALAKIDQSKEYIVHKKREWFKWSDLYTLGVTWVWRNAILRPLETMHLKSKPIDNKATQEKREAAKANVNNEYTKKLEDINAQLNAIKAQLAAQNIIEREGRYYQQRAAIEQEEERID